MIELKVKITPLCDVDNLMIAGSDSVMHALTENLSKFFKTNRLGELVQYSILSLVSD